MREGGAGLAVKELKINAISAAEKMQHLLICGLGLAVFSEGICSRSAALYGGLLASKDTFTNYLHIITNYLPIITNLSFDSQLRAYWRQKHIISQYFNMISNYVHIIVPARLSCCFQRLTGVEST